MAKKRRKNKYGLIPGSRRAGFVIPEQELYTVIANERQKYLSAQPHARSHYYYMTILLAHGLGLRGTDAVNITWGQAIDLHDHGELIIEESKKEHLKGTRKYSKQRLPRINAFTKLMREAYRAQYQHLIPSRKVFSNLDPVYYEATKGRGHTPFDDNLVNVDTLQRWYDRVMKRNKVFVDGRHGGRPYWSCARVTWGRMQYDKLIEVDGLNGRKRYTPDQVIAHLQSMFNHSTPQMTRHYLRLGSHDNEVIDAINESFDVGTMLGNYDSNRVYDPSRPSHRSAAMRKAHPMNQEPTKFDPTTVGEKVNSVDRQRMNRAFANQTNDLDFDLMNEISNVSSES